MDATETPSLSAVEEVGRIMTICNACRYCEGLCAVFPAMEQHREFTPGTLNHLASLCHGCGACLDDCQFAPPHEFAVNVPRSMAALRRDSYAAHAWPRAAGAAFRRSGLVNTVVVILCIAGFLAAIVPAMPDAAASLAEPGAFYRLMPHGAMVALFGTAFVYAIIAIALGVRNFWHAAGPAPAIGGRALARALHDGARLRYLDGGGAGCPDTQDTPRDRRRVFHHLVFYGFLLCFAATCVATLYHYALHREAPYPWLSAPVILGTLGGIGLVIGAPGLLAEKRRRRASFADPDNAGMDSSFVVMLFLLGVTGLALLVLRETALAGMLLCVHLGVVLGFFLTMPYGKFVHGIWRLAALIRHASGQDSVS